MSSCDSNFLLSMLDHWATSCFLVSDDVFSASTVHWALSFFLGVQYSQLFLFVLCLFPVERRYTRTSPFSISFHEVFNLLVHKPQVQLFVRTPLPTPLRHQNKTIFQRFFSNTHFVQWMESCTEVREYISELLSFLKIFVSYCNIMEMTCLSVFNRQSYSQANTFGKKKWSL